MYNIENWEINCTPEALETLEETEKMVISDEEIIQAYYNNKLSRANRRITTLNIKRRRRAMKRGIS